MMTVRSRAALLAMTGVALYATFSASRLAAQKVMATHANGATAQAQEWGRLETLLSGIHGISTAPPANLISSKYTSGALMGNGDIGVVAGDPLPTQQTFWFGKSDFWGSHWNARHNNTEVSILSLGHLTLSSPVKAHDAETGYRVDQDILHARVDSSLKLGEATVHLRSWTAEQENLFLTEVKADGNSPVPLTLTLAMPAPDPEAHTTFPADVGFRNGALWANRENNLTGATDYKARAAIAVHLIGSQLTEPATATNSAAATFVLKPGVSVWIVTSFESDARMNPDGPTATTLTDHSLERAAQVTRTRISALEREHLNWWKQFWLRSFIEVHDKVLEDYYYGALYVLGASSRPGKLPPSLWSNFLTTDNAGWGGRYFMNYNEEAPFYGVFSSNRPELAEPYNRMVLAQFPWQKNRTAAAGYKGVAFQRTFSPFTVIAQPPAPVTIASEKNWKKLPSDQKSNATFSLLPTIQYYDYTQDLEFLRTKLYPAMKELDAFWRDFAVRDTTGKQWIFEHTAAHEGGDDVNASLDIGFARRVARELIETSKVLDLDAEMRPVWQSFLNQLTPYPSGTVNSKTVYYIAESIKNNIKNQGLFEPGDQPINLEGPVYPGENLSIGGNPQELEIARNSMEEMHSWAVTKGGNSFNGFCKIFPIAARIGWPADDLVAKFKAAIQYQWRPSNLTVSQGGGGIETAGSIEALNSMLLQHEDGVMRLFPDWPSTMDASFTRLRAKGAFLVSSQQRSGKVVAIDITSDKGGLLVIQSPWGNSPVRASGNPSLLSPDSNGRISLKTVAGKSYHLSAQ